MAVTDIFWRVGREAGLPDHVIQGYVANFIFESGGRTDINPTARGDGGHAYGAAQWNDRSDELMRFAQQMGTSWTDPETQARFWIHEINGPERAAHERVMSARDPAEAVRLVSNHYERPGTPHIEGRIGALQYAGGPSGGQAMAYAPTSQPTGAQAAAASMAGNTGADVTSPAMSFPILDRIKARLGDKPTPLLDKLRSRLTEFRTNQMERWGGAQPSPPVMPPQPSTASQLTPGGPWEGGTMPQYPAAGTAQQPPASPAGANAGYLAAMAAQANQAPQQTLGPMMPQGFQPSPPAPEPQMPNVYGPLMPQNARGWGVYPPMGPQGAQGKTTGPSALNLANILGLFRS